MITQLGRNAFQIYLIFVLFSIKFTDFVWENKYLKVANASNAKLAERL